MLMRARMEMDRLLPGFKRNALGVSAFVLGGAVLLTLVRWLSEWLSSDESASDQGWRQSQLALAPLALPGLRRVAVRWGRRS